MKLQHALVAFSALAFCTAGHAQTFIAPFVGAPNENFNTIPLGSVPAFLGFAGTGSFSRIGTGGLLLTTNMPGLLPPVTGNAMFGRGVDVRIRFQSTMKRWGGVFRVPNAGIAVTTMRVEFYRMGAPVGVPVFATVNNTSWQWRGWDVGSLGGYDEVRIFGNGTLPGYVGMENLRRG